MPVKPCTREYIFQRDPVSPPKWIGPRKSQASRPRTQGSSSCSDPKPIYSSPCNFLLYDAKSQVRGRTKLGSRATLLRQAPGSQAVTGSPTPPACHGARRRRRSCLRLMAVLVEAYSLSRLEGEAKGKSFWVGKNPLAPSHESGRGSFLRLP